MSENSQDGFQTLGWIINNSEQGLYLVVAEEQMQKKMGGAAPSHLLHLTDSVSPETRSSSHDRNGIPLLECLPLRSRPDP